MNPFANATILGYAPTDILSFLKKSNPKMADKISKAMALGYSAQEIMDFLGKSFDGSTPKDKKRGPDYESALRVMQSPAESSMEQARAERENKEQDVLSTVLQRGAAGAVGAGIGGLVGGPMGAVAGGVAGATGTDELMNKYQEHVNTGGSLGLVDWLKSIMKGGAAGAAALQAPKLLAAIQAGSLGGQQPEAKAQPEGGLTPPGTDPLPGGMGPEQSAKALEEQNLGQFLQGFGPKLSQQDFIDYMKSEMGDAKFKALGAQYNRPPEEIVGQAWEFVQSEAQQPAPTPTVPPVPQPQGTQQGIPTEESVEQDVLQEMGAIPAPTVQRTPTAQPPLPTPTMAPTPEERPSGRYVKPLDMAEGDESFIADVFHNIFEEPEYPTAPKDSKREIAPMAQALKSSNVGGATWNKDTGELRVIFKPPPGTKEGGGVYKYPDVTQEDWEHLSGGKSKPITEGENIYGIWDPDKKKSHGASFHNKIKSNPEKYPHTQLAEKDITVTENQIRSADRAFMVSDLFAPFKKLRDDGKRLTKASQLNEWVQNYAGHNPEDIYTMIELTEQKLKDVLKGPPSKGRLKKEITKEYGVEFRPTHAEQQKIMKKAQKKREQEAKKRGKSK